jgi:YHS domain-containing protein
MALGPRLVVLESSDQPAAPCIVCGNDISAGEGVTASYEGRTLRFKCPGCFVRFEFNPERYLAGEQQSCRDGTHDHSPASEWCDQ